jgi:hypothetical protein
MLQEDRFQILEKTLEKAGNTLKSSQMEILKTIKMRI